MSKWHKFWTKKKKGGGRETKLILAMVRSVLLDKESWTEHIMLDPDTGLDPPGYKVRAVHGKELKNRFKPNVSKKRERK